LRRHPKIIVFLISSSKSLTRFPSCLNFPLENLAKRFVPNLAQTPGYFYFLKSFNLSEILARVLFPEGQYGVANNPDLD